MASYSQNNFYYKNNLSDKTIGSPHNQGDVPIYNDYLFYGLELCKRNPSSNQNNYYVNVSNVNSNVNYSEELDLSLSNLENSKPSLNELFDNLTNIIGSTLFNDYLDNKLHGYNTTWQNPYTYMKAYKLLDEISNITYELWPGTLIGKRSDNGYYSPVTPNNTVETGESVNLVNTGNPPVGYKFQYSRDNNSWSNTIPTIQSVRGTYTTYWRLIENGSESKPLLISKVTTTIAEPDTIIVYDTDYTMPVAKQGLIYNGSEQQLLIGGSCEYGVFTYGYNNGAQGMPIQSITATNASTYQIDWRLVLRDGYIFENGTTFKIGTITCIIGKAQGSLDAETTAIIVGYNNDAIAGSIIDEKPVRTYFSWEGDGTIEFTSSNENVARIYNNYIYVYNREGIATLTARITNGSNYYYGSSPSDGFDEVFIDLTVDGQIETLYDNDVTINPTEYVYDGTAKTPSVTVIHNGNTLVKNTDYTVTYEDNTNVGNAKCKITGKGDYTGEITKPFDIKQKQISDVTITLNPSSYTYNGSEHKPTPTVKDGTKTLTLNTDYIVSYINNINAGTATCMITGNGNYTGSKGQSFTINRATLTSADIRITSNYDNVIYEGAPLTLFKLINNKHINNESILVYERGSAGEASSSELGLAMQNYTNQTPTVSRFHSLGESSGEFKTYTGEGTWYIYYCVDDPNYNRYPTSNFLYATSTIQSEQSLLTSAPVGNMNLTYDGTVQPLLINEGTTSDGHLEYNTNDWGWGTTLPVSTYVGEYTIKYRIVRNNGRIVEDNSWVTTAKINKGSGSISLKSVSQLLYSTAGLRGRGGEILDIFDYFDVVGDLNDISYSCWWDEDDNVPSMPLGLEVYIDDKRNIRIDDEITVPNKDRITYHVMLYVRPDIETNYNYSPNEAILDIIIEQSVNPCTISQANWTYGETAPIYSLTYHSDPYGDPVIDILYKVQGADDSTFISTKPTNAGKYTIRAVVHDYPERTGSNYAIIYTGATVEADFEIYKANITSTNISINTSDARASVGQHGYIAKGTNLLNAKSNWNVTGVNNEVLSVNDYHYKIYENSSLANPAGIDAVTPLLTDSMSTSNFSIRDYAFSIRLYGMSNYNDYLTSPGNMTIEPANLTDLYIAPAIKDNLSNLEEGDDILKDESGKIKDACRSIADYYVFKYKTNYPGDWDDTEFNEFRPEYAGLGQYIIAWKLERKYITGQGQTVVSGSVSKASTGVITQSDITSPTAKTGLTYNTSAQSLINAGSITDNKGTIKYSVNSSNISNFSTTIPTGTNAGTYTIRWYIEPNDNYELDSSLPSSTNPSSFTVQINKANIIGGIVTTVPGLTYNGGTQGLFNITRPSNGDSNIKLYIESSTENIDGLLSQNPTITVNTVPTNYTQSVTFAFTTQSGSQTANRSFICQEQEIQSRSLRINAGTNVLYYYFNDANNNYNVTSIRKVEGIIEQADGGFFLNSGDSSNPLSIDAGASVEYMDWDVHSNYYYGSDSYEYTVKISGNNGGADNNIATIEYVSGNSGYMGIKITGVSAGTGTFNLLFTPSNTNYAPETLTVYFSIVQAQQVQNNIRYSIYSTDVTYPVDLNAPQLNATVDEDKTLRIKFIDDNNNNISDQITVNVDGNSSTAVTCFHVGDVTLNGELYKKFNITGVQVPRSLNGDEPKLILTTNATNNYMAKTITIYLNVNKGTRTLYHNSSADLWFGSPNSFENVGDKVTAAIEIHNKYGNKITDVERINTIGFSVVFNNPSNFDYSNYFSIDTKVFNEQTCTWLFTVTYNNAMSFNNQTAIANMVQLTIKYFDINYTADDLQINFPVNIRIQDEA
jgi:hypothetical protein